MAPTVPKKRPSMRSKASKPTTSSTTTTPTTNPRPSTLTRSYPASSTFMNTKSDKRLIKHSTFISRIEKTSQKPLKRRRPNKKLVTTMESLVDALPDVEELIKRHEGGKVEMKSLSHGRGFMKRRDKVERGERERFGRNLGIILAGNKEQENRAQVTDGIKAPAAAPSATAGRFAAIRAWVNNNMEKHEGFEKKG